MTKRSKEQDAATKAIHNGFSLISDEKLLQLYTSMVKCRMIEERARGLLKQNELADKDEIAMGREASEVGATIDLLAEDTVVPLSRDVAVNYIKGVSLDKIFGQISARADEPVPASPLDLATSAALANKTKKNGKIAVAFLGDGTASHGSFHEALTTARAHQLPILFICHEILSTESGSRSLQAEIEKIALEEQPCSFPHIAVDGNDVVAVYRVATEAIAHARRGNGPTFIECKGERSKAHDPILNMEMYLKRKGLFSKKTKLEIAAGFTEILDAASR
jgi:pyruvate dehydrogenase E1 component alpha subunit